VRVLRLLQGIGLCAPFLLTAAERPSLPLLNVRAFGAAGDGETDDRAALQRAFHAAAGRCLHFPPGEYRISGYIELLASGSCLLGGPGVIIRNTTPLLGVPKDGFRIGNPSPRDGGTGQGIAHSDIYISGFHFTGTRMGIWIVYSRRVTVENISTDGYAAVAAGNDNDDDCEDIIFRNITRTGPSPADWYTAAVFKTRRFLIDGVLSPYPNGKSMHVAAANSEDGIISNVIAQGDSPAHGSGIELIDSRAVTVTGFQIRGVKKGVVAYCGRPYCTGPERRLESHHVIGPGSVRGSTDAIFLYTSKNLVTGVLTTGNQASLRFGTDARDNNVSGCYFQERAVVPKEAAARNAVTPIPASPSVR
jgi:hypothetical protein